MDVMSDILATLRLATTILSRARFTAPWAVRSDGRPQAIFHGVVKGSCWITHVATGQSLPLEAGDVVVLPQGDAHIMGNRPETPPVPMSSLYEADRTAPDGALEFGGSGDQTSVLCGTFHLDHVGAHAFTSLLPAVLGLSHAQPETGAWMATTLKMIDAELERGNAGVDTVVTRLTDVLFVYVLRSYAETLPETSRGWFAATRDPHIGRALAVIHREPGEKWSAARLARQVGLSRSAFFARFTELVGEPPAQYLTRWRMNSAADALRRSGDGVGALAERLGYGSEDAFRRAFKRVHGVSPANYRRQAIRAA